MNTSFRGSAVVASVFGVGVATLVACTADPTPAQSTTPEAGSPEASATPTADGGFPVLPYPPGPYGLGIGEVMPDITLQGYRLSREVTSAKDLALSSFRLSDVRSDPACTCMVVVYSVAGKNCVHAIELNSTLSSIIAKDPTICAAEIVAFNFDAIDPATRQLMPPTTTADLDAVVAGAHLPFPTGIPTPSVHEAGFDVIAASIPDFFIVRPSDMKISAFYGGNGDVEARLRSACSAPKPAVETVATGLVAPRHMVKDATHAYLSDAGRVVRISLAGGAIDTVATPAATADALALDDDHVYWATHDGGSGTFELGRIAKAGGSPETLTSGASGYTSIALDDTNVWFTRADGVIGSIPRAGGPETTFTTDPGATSLVADSTSLYWIAGGNVVSQAKSAGTRTVLAVPADFKSPASKEATPVELALAGTDVVVRATTPPEGTLVAKLPKSGGAATLFDGGYPTTMGISPSGEIYVAYADPAWEASAIGHFLPPAIDPMEQAILTVGQHVVNTIAHDDTYAWWTDATSAGAVLKRIKNP